MGKNKLAKWTEFGSFDNVIEPKIGDIASSDHPIKGRWKTEMFKNDNPVILELGCGKGEYSVGLANRFPENNYIGIDIKGSRMWRGAKTANEQKLTNVAFLRTRIEFINSFFETDEVSEIWITFPDPHPGGRNANKRLPSPRFLNSYRSFLKNNGVVHLKTDNTELYKYTKSVVTFNNLQIIFDTSDLYNHISDTTSAGSSEIKSPSADSGAVKRISDDILSIRTHYERLFMNRGMKINYVSFKLPKEKTIEDATGKTKGEE